MFRLLKLKPPHGWTAVAWELGIVTLGVLIALAAQQWANDRAQRNQMDVSMNAVREEMAEHYGYAVEYRVVYPCLRAQMDRLRDRVLNSGATVDPLPLYQDETFHYVIREPSKNYPSDAWQAAVADGTTQRLEPGMRRILAGHHAQIPIIEDITIANEASDMAFIALTHPLPLDADVRFSILKEVEQERARMENMDFLNGQLIDYIQSAGALPPAKDAIAVVQHYGTYQFCKAHGLPTRSFKDAMQAVPN